MEDRLSRDSAAPAQTGDFSFMEVDNFFLQKDFGQKKEMHWQSSLIFLPQIFLQRENV